MIIKRYRYERGLIYNKKEDGNNTAVLQSIFIVPAMQHGCRAKPLYS